MVQVAAPEASVAVLLVSQEIAAPEADVTTKVTVPVGVPALAGIPITVALTVAGLPEPAGGLTATLVLEPVCEIAWVKVPVEVAKFASPE